MPPLESVSRSISLALLVATTVVGCSAPGIPRGPATEIHVENCLYDPPRSIGLVNKQHPDLSAIHNRGVKALSGDEMGVLLDNLEDRGLLEAGARMDQLPELNREATRARLWLASEGQVFVVTLPYKAPPEEINRFNRLIEPVTTFHHYTGTARADRTVTGDDLMRQHFQLQRANRKKAEHGTRGPD